jgi:hypothetical protein
MRIVCDWATALVIFHGKMIEPATPLYVTHIPGGQGNRAYAVNTERTGEYVMLKKEP